MDETREAQCMSPTGQLFTGSKEYIKGVEAGLKEITKLDVFQEGFHLGYVQGRDDASFVGFVRRLRTWR